MQFFYIVPVVVDRLDYMVEEAKRLYQECQLDTPLVCYTLQPEGNDIQEKVEVFRDLFHRYREALASTPVKPGILFQSLIGHGWVGGPEANVPFQRVRTIRDEASDRFCLLDQGFQQYLYNTVRIMAAEKPSFLLVDDDMRQIDGHGLECFCPLHVKQFNEAANTNFSASELQECIRSSKAGDPMLEIFESLRRTNLSNTVRNIRRAIDEVDPTLPCGYCTPGCEMLTAQNSGQILAGKHNAPIVRLNNANYLEGSPRELIQVNYNSWAIRSMMPEIQNFLDESDTFPQHRYSKSATSMNSKITLAAWNGFAGCKLWFTNLTTPDNKVESFYDKIFAANVNKYNAIESFMGQADRCGAVTPLPGADVYNKMFHPLATENLYYRTDWQSQLFSRFGIPAKYAILDQAGEDPVFLISGDMLRFFSDGEITFMLSRKAILDGSAARELAKRDFSDLLGVTVGNDYFRCGAEFDPDSQRRLLFMNNGTAARINPATPETRELSRIIKLDYHYASKTERIASGVTLFKNRLGGTVVVFAMSLEMPFIEHPHRSER